MGRRVAHNPKMQQHWYAVPVDLPRQPEKPHPFAGQVVDVDNLQVEQKKSLDEIRLGLRRAGEHQLKIKRGQEWCDREIAGRWTFGSERDSAYYHSNVFRFVARLDAIRFKLSWHHI